MDPITKPTTVRRSASTCLSLLLILSSIHAARAGDWTRFRGPNGSGVSTATSLPTNLDPNLNALWRTEVPFSRSSPILSGDSLYLTSSDEERLIVMSLDAATGDVRWRHNLNRDADADIYYENDSASSSPATDGVNIFAFFQEFGLISLTLEGELRWSLPLGPFHAFYGLGSSPIVAGDLVIMLCDQQKDSFIVAVDKDTGKVRWRVERSLHGSSFSTPVLYPSADDPQIAIVHGHGWIDAYDLATGDRLWGTPGLGSGPVASLVLDGDTLIIPAPNESEDAFPFPKFEQLCGLYDANKDARITKTELGNHLIAKHFGWGDVDRDGFIDSDEYAHIYGEMVNDDYGLMAYDVSSAKADGEPKRIWRERKDLPKNSSPLLYNGVVYSIKNGGVLVSIDATTGKVIKKARVPESGGAYYSSPVAADGKIYIANKTGSVAVLKAEGQWEVLAVNKLGEEIYATPIPADGRIFIRTHRALYAFE